MFWFSNLLNTKSHNDPHSCRWCKKIHEFDRNTMQIHLNLYQTFPISIGPVFFVFNAKEIFEFIIYGRVNKPLSRKFQFDNVMAKISLDWNFWEENSNIFYVCQHDSCNNVSPFPDIIFRMSMRSLLATEYALSILFQLTTKMFWWEWRGETPYFFWKNTCLLAFFHQFSAQRSTMTIHLCETCWNINPFVFRILQNLRSQIRIPKLTVLKRFKERGSMLYWVELRLLFCCTCMSREHTS